MKRGCRTSKFSVEKTSGTILNCKVKQSFENENVTQHILKKISAGYWMLVKYHEKKNSVKTFFDQIFSEKNVDCLL